MDVVVGEGSASERLWGVGAGVVGLRPQGDDPERGEEIEGAAHDFGDSRGLLSGWISV